MRTSGRRKWKGGERKGRWARSQRVSIAGRASGALLGHDQAGAFGGERVQEQGESDGWAWGGFRGQGGLEDRAPQGLHGGLPPEPFRILAGRHGQLDVAQRLAAEGGETLVLGGDGERP